MACVFYFCRRGALFIPDAASSFAIYNPLEDENMPGKLSTVKYLLPVLMLATLLFGAIPALAEKGPRDATNFTKELNAIYLQSLPFDDRRDFEDAQRGFIAPLYEEGVLKNDKGEIIY